MRHTRWTLSLLGVVALLLTIRAYSQVKSIELPPDNPMSQLKPGPGVEVARANCVMCHSTDYIVRQPRGDAKHWEGEVKKMSVVYGASISEADAKTITDYLAAAYGTDQSEKVSKDTPAKTKSKAP